ncbi:nSTAND1 domain-containing NTPase [Rhizobium ruizarguesonis]|uniref:nSTAND1 domain-containing NTPase n=1 Tax=Rhizobium ruizarguesonis TaxID=2081791 RepID=UPI0013EE8041|nr:TIR domain-containing protein [Rhizobium ruizarguesonis]
MSEASTAKFAAGVERAPQRVAEHNLRRQIVGFHARRREKTASFSHSAAEAAARVKLNPELDTRMARIFISHSSRDNGAADRMKAWLASQGFENVFLDKDSKTGIPPGTDWEKTLYQAIEQCQAVIILQTPNWLTSKWCFAEFTQARALGKVIFPLIEAPTDGARISPDLQTLDLTRDRTGALERLGRELVRIALDTQGGFVWNANRPPYPGLLYFQEDDAAVYFGRDDDIRRLIERLEARRTQGGAKLVTLLGWSGSGKSSLLRAGVIPRLKRAGSNWIVVPPIRPDRRPVVELAQALAKSRGQPGEWRKLQGDLLGPDPAQALDDLAHDLQAKANGSETPILIPIDQGEELFSVSDPDEAQRFVEILSHAASGNLPFLILMALRSDYLGQLQCAKSLTARFEEFSLAPMPLARIPDIIQGPARVAGLRVEAAFVQRAVRDAETEDALPLLAFALRELLDRSPNKFLSLDSYDALGDAKAELTPLENAVSRAADETLVEANPEADELTALREAFVPAMVRVNDQGEYVRHPARLDELPLKSLRLLQLLAKRRLLTIGQNEVEVAHEALLRKWPQLRSWLDAEREFLIGKQQLEKDARDWEHAADGDKAGALLTGLKLNRARTWLSRYPKQLSAIERSFIQASIKRDDSQARTWRIITWVAIATAVVLAVVALWAVLENHKAQVSAQLARVNEARAFTALARGAIDEHRPRAAIAFALAAWPSDGDDVIPQDKGNLATLSSAIAELRPVLCRSEGHTASNLGAFFLGDDSLVSWHDNTVELRHGADCTKVVRQMKHGGLVHGALLLPDKKSILSWSNDGSVSRWDLTTGARIGNKWNHNYDVLGVKLLPDGKRAISWTYYTLKLWDVSSGMQIGPDMGNYVGAYERLSDVEVLDNDHIIVVFEDTVAVPAVIWTLSTREEHIPRFTTATGEDSVVTGATSLTRTAPPILLTSGAMLPWDSTLGHLTETKIPRDNAAGAIVAGRLGRLFSWSNFGKGIESWDMETRTMAGHLVEGQTVENAILSGDESRLFSWSRDREIRQWNTLTAKEVGSTIYADDRINGLSSNDKGDLLAVWTQNGDITVYKNQTKNTISVNRAVGDKKHYKVVLAGATFKIISIDETSLVLLDSNGVQIGQTISCQSVCDYSGENFSVSTMGEKFAVWGADESSVSLLDFPDGKYESIDLGRKSIESVIPYSDGKRIAFVSDKRLWIKNVDDGTIRTPAASSDNILSFQLNNNDTEFVINEGGKIEIIEDKAGKIVGKPLNANGADNDQFFEGFYTTDFGKNLISWTDREIDFWDLQSGNLLKSFRLGEGEDQNGMQVMLVGASHRILFWGDDPESSSTRLRQIDVATGEQIGVDMDMEHVIRGVSVFDRDTRILAWSRAEIRVWDSATGQQLGPTMTGTFEAASLTSDGKRIIGWDNGRVSVWDTMTGQRLGDYLNYADESQSEELTKLANGFDHGSKEINLASRIDEEAIKLRSGENGSASINFLWGDGTLFQIGCAAIGGAQSGDEFSKYKLGASRDICGTRFRPAPPEWWRVGGP